LSFILAQVQHVRLSPIDLVVVVVYLFAAVGLGFLVSFGKKRTTRGYFLGGKTLPWYVIACSMLASDVSSEHFIANAGIGFTYGIVAATGSWNAWIIYSIFIFIFLPYYVRTNLYTIPEFLERRYNAVCRYIFSAALLAGYIGAIMAGTLYAGGLAFERMLGPFIGGTQHGQIVAGIIFFAIITGAYTIYGGLRSAAWTDFMQIIVLGAGGILVPILGLKAVGGFGPLVHSAPDHFQIFLPVDHPKVPFTGVFTGFLTVGIWYTCTSQHMVQRVLAAKDEWNARMGVIGAGYLHIITPFFFVFPGIIAFKLLGPNFKPADASYLTLVEQLVWPGLRGLILAAMAAALMSNLSAVLNSASTLVTIDFYRKVFRPHSTDDQQVRFGQIAGVFILAASVVIAWYFSLTPRAPLFIKVQNVFFFIAPPFSVIFCAGLLWRKANTPAALFTIVSGFIFSFLFDRFIKGQQGVYLHRALFTWCFCVLAMVVVTYLTEEFTNRLRRRMVESTDGVGAESVRVATSDAIGASESPAASAPTLIFNAASLQLSRLERVLTTPPMSQVNQIVWTRKYARLPLEERRRYHGIRDFRIWWLLFIGIVWAIYAVFAWFRVQHPVPMFHWKW
jgi:SSS family solute:Na+ symporter